MENGKVIEYESDINFCVEFERFNNIFHNCNGKGKDRFCWWVSNDELLEKEEKNG